MKKLMTLSLIIFAALGDVAKTGGFAFEWKSSSLFPNGTVVQACVGDNVTLPWVFDMTSPKEVVIEWSKTSKEQEKSLVLSRYSGDTFHRLVPDRDLKFLPNAGIMLPGVIQADTGYYKVEVILREHFELYKQEAFLHVSDAPAELHAFILPESVYNSATGLWYVQLGCRPPVTRGQSALPVIWTTPSNRTAISTSYNNNTFILELSLPVEEGDYSCSLNWSVTAVKCLNTHLINSRAATVNVEGVNTRLSYLKRSLETLWKETADLNGSLCHLTDIVQHLETSEKKCDEEIINLNQTTENMKSVLQNLLTKNEKMTSKFNCLESITTTAQIKYDNMSVMLLSKFENLTDMIQEKNGSMTALVQRNNDNLTAMVQSKFDDMTAMVQRNNDNLTAMVQNISALFQSKFDNINDIVLQLQSGIEYLLRTDFAQRPRSCIDVQKYDTVSGVHTLLQDDYRPVKAYCDQTPDMGGWTVIQRRQDGTVDFYRNWVQYEIGFGDLDGEFWIGLANLYKLTTYMDYELRVDITHFNGSIAYAMYNTFSISDARDYYRLNVGEYSGSAGDSLTYSNKQQFSTFDRDNDLFILNCAVRFQGAWWYSIPFLSNLNGRYKSDGATGNNGVIWRSWKSGLRSLKRVEMKIRPKKNRVTV